MTRPEGGRSPLILWSLVLAVVTADVVLDGPLRSLDHSVASWLRAHFDITASRGGAGRLPQETALLLLTELGSPPLMPLLGALYAVYLAARHRTLRPPARLAVACLLTLAVVSAVKIGVGRTLPTDDVLWTAAGRSYPSGHTATAVVVWGVVAWLAADYGSGLRGAARVMAWLGPLLTATAMVVLVFHWVTDVLAGAAVAVLLLAVARTVDRVALAHLPGADRGIAGDRGVDRGGVGAGRGAGRGGRPGAVHDPRPADR